MLFSFEQLHKSHSSDLEAGEIVKVFLQLGKKKIYTFIFKARNFLTIAERPRIKWEVQQKRRHGFASACMSLFC